MAWGVRTGATATVSGGSGLGQSFTLALGAAVVVGDRIVVAFSGASGGVGFTVNSITDSLGNTYTLDASVVQSTGAQAVQCWSAPVTTAGTPTLTINMSDFAFNGCSVAVATYTGLSTTSGAGAIDTSGTGTGSNGSVSISAGTTTAANELLLGIWGDSGTASSASDAVAGTGFTQRVSALPHTSSTGDAIIEDKDSGAAGAQSVTMNNSAGLLLYGMVGIAYKLAAGGAVVSPPPGQRRRSDPWHLARAWSSFR